jgi:hypothetical protein
MTPEELELHMSPEENGEEEEEVYKKIFDWKTLLTDRELKIVEDGLPYWPTAKPSLPLRLLGVQAVGPNADQMTRNDTPEFGWRRLYLTPPTAIMFEASARIQELEAELQKMRERFFERECDSRGI